VDLITTAEFAEIARTSPETVRYWRHIGRGPAGFKVGRRVVYERSSVVQWLRDLRDAEARTA
jgi:DNA-binding transcriptional MerR regulator